LAPVMRTTLPSMSDMQSTSRACRIKIGRVDLDRRDRFGDTMRARLTP